MLKRLGTQRATYLILFILLFFLPYSPAHSAVTRGYEILPGINGIVTAPGPVTTNTALIKIYKNNGTAVASFQAFTNSASGANVCLGDLGY